jgi:redox-sensitive bicupin YhaK (pirin superfamily)
VLLVVVMAAPPPCPAVFVGQPKALRREPWPTLDPFLFCAYHNDAYPASRADGSSLGPDPSLLDGREIGSDFSYKDGWSMYHGTTVPGFPAHPHSGFETVTIPLRGLVDHFDSLGATGRYGNGDVQWLTTGKGVLHSEMFPLLNQDAPNPLELFQLWLNLPKADKKAKPAFTMYWGHRVPKYVDAEQRVNITVVAGELHGSYPAPPPPDSWARPNEHHAAIWIIQLAPTKHQEASATIPAIFTDKVNRMIYHVRGPANVDTIVSPLRAGCSGKDDRKLPLKHAIQTNSKVMTSIRAVCKKGKACDGDEPTMLLVLQGLQIDEKVVKHGPFVASSDDELSGMHAEYRKTQYGGWPWPSEDHHHPRDEERFASRSIGGKRELPSDPYDPEDPSPAPAPDFFEL